MSTGECLKLLGHGSQVLSTVFIADGGILSNSADNTIKSWNLVTGECLKTLQGHSNWVWSLTLSPDKQILASVSQYETIKFWNATTGKCLRTLRVPRPYEGMNIRGVTGLNQATVATLKALGVVEVQIDAMSDRTSTPRLISGSLHFTLIITLCLPLVELIAGSLAV